jgi:hypothetical protein
VWDFWGEGEGRGIKERDGKRILFPCFDLSVWKCKLKNFSLFG